MMQATFQKHPDNWIKFLIGIGLVGLFFMVSIPSLLGSLSLNEEQRFRECQNHTRTDCNPSFLWLWNAWDLAIRPVPPADITATSTPDTRSYRSSLTAPRILSVDLAGTIIKDGWYYAPAGTTVTTTVQVADAKMVDLYLIPKGSEAAGLATKVASLKRQKSGLYVGTFKISGDLAADLEVRATGATKDTASLFLHVAAQ